MPLFKISAPLDDGLFVETKLNTPLGDLSFCPWVGDERLRVSESLRGEGGLQLRRYAHVDLDVEFLIVPFVAKIPEDMRVDASFLGAWRAFAKRDAPPLTLRAEWMPGSRNDDGEYETGERLTAFTWYAPDAQVTVGTGDEEVLAYAAKIGLLPTRFAYAFEVDHEHWPQAYRNGQGFEVPLPSLRAGESARVHMATAWRSGDLEEQEVSPWFAVDVPIEEVSRLIGEV